MLGLPDGTRACLFDLDGVLTDTASVHAAAWKQMFDDFLRARAERTGTPFEPFDVKTDYGPYVDGKPRLDGTRGFLASRGITLPDGEPTDGPDAETVNGLATRKNELVHEKIRTVGVDVYPGSVRYLHAVRDAGLTTAVVSSSANAEVVLQVAGLADLIDHRVDGVVAKQRQPARQARARHVPRRGGGPGRAEGAGRRVRGRPRRRRVRAARAGSASSSAWTGSGRPTRCASTARTSSSPTSPMLAGARSPGGEPMSPDPGRPFTVEPWVVREPSLDMESLGVTETVFALSNGHIGLRGNLDEGEPHATPGTYLNSFYERRPLPYAEGGYGYPESGQTIINVTNGKIIRLLVDDEPFDLRYGQVHRHQRVLDLQSGTLTREVRWSSPAGKTVKVRSERLVSLTQRAVAAICYEVEVEDPALIVVQSELVANEQLPTSSRRRPARRGRAAQPAGRRAAPQRRRRRDARPPHPPLRAARGRGDGPRGPRPRGHQDHLRGQRGHRAHHGHLPAGAGHRAAGGQVPGLRLVVAAVAACRARPGPGRARGRPLHRLGGAARRAAHVPRRVLDHRGRRDRRRRRAAAGRPRRGVPRAAGRRAGGAPGDRRQGPDRAGLRRPHVLGHRDVLPAGAQPPPARRRGGRPALAPVDPAAGPRAGPAAGPERRGVPVADDPRPGVLGLLAGRARRRSTSTPTSPTPSAATC